jgi:hypothetical protein
MSDMVQTSTEGGNGAAEHAQGKAKAVASQAQDKARGAAGQARGRMREQVDRRSTHVGEQVSSGVSDVRSVADELRKQGKDIPARYVEQAADRGERLGGYLRDSDGERLLGDVEDLARRNAWVVVLGGLALGFAASRLLKASSTERYRSSLGRSGTGGLRPSTPQSEAATGGRVPGESDLPAGAAADPATGGFPARAAGSQES